VQGVAFQWVNPKGWVTALGAVYAYTSRAYDLTVQVVVLCIIFFVTGIFTTGTWTLFGNAIGRVLRTDRQRKLFNYAMAGLLLLSIIPVLTSE
jgi:threonine/homoserine/homoserine lactone efflux protein